MLGTVLQSLRRQNVTNEFYHATVMHVNRNKFFFDTIGFYCKKTFSFSQQHICYHSTCTSMLPYSLSHLFILSTSQKLNCIK